MFSNISTSLERFIQVLKSTGRYALQQANAAYHELQQNVWLDIESRLRDLKQIKAKYRKQRGAKVSLAIALLEQTHWSVTRTLVYGNATQLDDKESLKVYMYIFCLLVCLHAHK